MYIIGLIIINDKHTSNDSISFEETFNKSGLPIITLNNRDYPLNFLIDTGSDVCCINKDSLKYIHYTQTNKKAHFVTTTGPVESQSVVISLNDKEDDVNIEFNVLDFSAQFKEIEEKNGVHIDGILGSRFCGDAGLIIDFSKLIVTI